MRITFASVPDKNDIKDLILNYHYAHRMPSVSYAFGLYANNELAGVITFGQPASRSLQTGMFGVEYASKVIELNRLYIKDEVSQTQKNITSKFVAWSLKQLKELNLAVVSFADSGMNHIGGIYQATNFMYLGKTKARTDRFSGFNKHSRHYDKNAKEVIRVYRTQKYKYLYLAMDKRNKKKFMKLLRYDILPYPKDLDDKHYKPGTTEIKWYRDEATGKKITETEARGLLL